MGTEITTNETFQERMFKRIRDQMGDLMTEAELKAIVDTAMQKAFFENRSVLDRGGYNKITQEPLFVELIRNQLSAQVSLQVSAWLKDHNDEVIKAIDDAIAKGFFALVQQHMEAKISGPLFQFSESLRQKGILL